jgi:hypothetical protein
MFPVVIRGLMTTVGRGVDALLEVLAATMLWLDDEAKAGEEEVPVPDTARLNCPGCHVDAAHSFEAIAMLVNEEKMPQKIRSLTVPAPLRNLMLEARGLGMSGNAARWMGRMAYLPGTEGVPTSGDLYDSYTTSQDKSCH